MLRISETLDWLVVGTYSDNPQSIQQLGSKQSVAIASRYKNSIHTFVWAVGMWRKKKTQNDTVRLLNVRGKDEYQLIVYDLKVNLIS